MYYHLAATLVLAFGFAWAIIQALPGSRYNLFDDEWHDEVDQL